MALRTLCLRVANPIGLDPDQTHEKKNRFQINPPGKQDPTLCIEFTYADFFYLNFYWSKFMEKV